MYPLSDSKRNLISLLTRQFIGIIKERVPKNWIFHDDHKYPTVNGYGMCQLNFFFATPEAKTRSKCFTLWIDAGNDEETPKPSKFEYRSVNGYRTRVFRFKETKKFQVENYFNECIDLMVQEMRLHESKVKTEKIKTVEKQFKAMAVSSISDEVFGKNILKETAGHTSFYQYTDVKGRQKNLTQLYIKPIENSEEQFKVGLVGMTLNHEQIKKLMIFMKECEIVRKEDLQDST